MSARFRRPGAPSRPDPTGLARLLADERFLRGLGLGAFIGAAIAGSTIWSRARSKHRAGHDASAAAADPVGPASHLGPPRQG